MGQGLSLDRVTSPKFSLGSGVKRSRSFSSKSQSCRAASVPTGGGLWAEVGSQGWFWFEVRSWSQRADASGESPGPCLL